MKYFLIFFIVISGSISGYCQVQSNKPGMDTSEVFMPTGFYGVESDSSNYQIARISDNQTYYLNPDILLPVDRFEKVKTKNYRPMKMYELHIHFDSLGTIECADVTQKYLYSRIAFIYNNKLINIPYVASPVTSGNLTFNLPNLERTEIRQIRKGIKRAIKDKNE